MLSHAASERQALWYIPLRVLLGGVSGALRAMGGAGSCFDFLHYIAVAYFHIILQFYQILLVRFLSARHEFGL